MRWIEESKSTHPLNEFFFQALAVNKKKIRTRKIDYYVFIKIKIYFLYDIIKIHLANMNRTRGKETSGNRRITFDLNKELILFL